MEIKYVITLRVCEVPQTNIPNIYLTIFKKTCPWKGWQRYFRVLRALFSFCLFCFSLCWESKRLLPITFLCMSACACTHTHTLTLKSLHFLIYAVLSSWYSLLFSENSQHSNLRRFLTTRLRHFHKVKDQTRISYSHG